MAVNLVSPGVNVREVDLTLGGITQESSNVAAIAGPFEKGPVGEPVLIENEQQLLDIFGKPKPQDDQYEYWMAASNYLSYGGVLRVIRTDVGFNEGQLVNANINSIGVSTQLTIKSSFDYENNHSDDANWIISAKNPGSWANNLKVCVIDNLADQIINGIGATNNITRTTEGFSTSVTLSNVTIGITTDRIIGVNTTGINLLDQINETTPEGIRFGATILGITSEGGGTLIFEPITINTGIVTANVDVGFVAITTTTEQANIQVGYAVTQNLSKTAVVGSELVTYDGYLRGLVTEVKENSISVRVTDRVDPNGVSYPIDYSNPGASGSGLNAFSFDSTREENIYVSNTTGIISTTSYPGSSVTIVDWYENQTLDLENSTLYWKSIARRPTTSQYANERNSKNDEIHVLVIDDVGTVTGTSGNILEKHLHLSKAVDGKISPSQQVYYKDYIANSSNYVYIGTGFTGTSSYLTSSGIGATVVTPTNDVWGTIAQGKKFNCVGSVTYTLTGGTDYSGVGYTGGYSVNNSDIINSYNILNNPAEYNVNYIICGPSGGNSIYEAQAKANAIIAIAQNRKDCVAVVSPYKAGVVNISNSTTQTNNIIEFFSPLTSSSYAVFDSGYKYTLDRFNNKLIYLACNSDVAGLMSRTATNNYPWFSPAGASRGALNNAIKLAYNPTQNQRDQLYTNRINPIIASPGQGIILFGDKTALSYASAFDRINVRTLFLTIEDSIRRAARAQLFEFNDAVTRSNFVNIVEPYLRDVRAKRGITDFLVICDETNNTPDIIDSNQFKADIFVKPPRSINFIGLTFVATRTGVEFSEVVGTV